MKMQKKSLFGLFLISASLSFISPFLFGEGNLDDKKEVSNAFQKPLINIIGWNNWVGLSRDLNILTDELTKLGYAVNFRDESDKSPLPKASINIFTDYVDEGFFPYGEKNYLIANPEWCFLSPQQIAKLDKIICKTREAERIFKPLNPNTIYLGFTSVDQWDKSTEKTYGSCLHLAGASVQKGTDAVIQAWAAHPKLPQLFLLRHRGNKTEPASANIKLINQYLSDAAIKEFENRCGIHICTSETEGFGHYIVEAMSCGAVVVATDAPPMNEFIRDKRCLVGYNRTAPMQLATNYYIDPAKLEQVVSNLLQLPVEELKAIGQKNREIYLENDRLFKQRFVELFKQAQSAPKEEDPIEKAFTLVYQNKLWGENPSGEGSLPEHTKIYCAFLQNFLKENQIHHVVDVGCGDWGFSKLVDWEGIQYEGYDIYKNIIEKNHAEFSKPNIRFIHGNAIEIELPKADLLICKDVLQHLPNHEISLFLPKLKNYRHCLIVNDVDPETLTCDNRDIPAGAYRLLDLKKPPYNLSGQRILTFVSGEVTKQVLYIRNEQ